MDKEKRSGDATTNHPWVEKVMVTKSVNCESYTPHEGEGKRT